jgi:hypothetical protein
MTAQQPIPLHADPAVLRQAERRSLVRACAALVLGNKPGVHPERIIKTWGDDAMAAAILAGHVAAGAGRASAGAGIDGLAAVAAGAATGGDGSGNGAAGVVAGVCAAAVGRGAAWAGARGRTGAKVLVCADAEWANATSGGSAASMANMQKRNGKALVDADRATRRPPWLPHGSVFMSHPPKPPSTPTLQTANLSSK